MNYALHVDSNNIQRILSNKKTMQMTGWRTIQIKVAELPTKVDRTPTVPHPGLPVLFNLVHAISWNASYAPNNATLSLQILRTSTLHQLVAVFFCTGVCASGSALVSTLGTRLPFSSLGMRSHPVLKRFLLASKRGKGCASVLSTILSRGRRSLGPKRRYMYLSVSAWTGG